MTGQSSLDCLAADVLDSTAPRASSELAHAQDVILNFENRPDALKELATNLN